MAVLVAACQTEKSTDSGSKNEAQLMYQYVRKLTDVIVVDVFNPPVASRIYAYATLAAYETDRKSVV